jgi:AraC-like DNA-binding protein
VPDDKGSLELSTAKLFNVFMRASQSASAYTASEITTRGLHIGEFAVLEVLLHKGPMTTAAIARKTRLTEALIVLAIERLETLGRVRRERSRSIDRRRWIVELTPEGQSLIEDIYEVYAQSIEQLFRPLCPSELFELYRVLKKVGLHSEGLQLARYKDRPGSLSPSQLRRATRFLASFSGSPLSIEEIAGKVGLSPAQFSRAFKISTGTPPYRWQLNLRIFKAQELLRYGSLSLAEIALATGFTEQSHFTRIFKKVTGASPGAWQRDHRQ